MPLLKKCVPLVASEIDKVKGGKTYIGWYDPLSTSFIRSVM